MLHRLNYHIGAVGSSQNTLSRLVFQKKLIKITRPWKVIKPNKGIRSIEIKLEPSENSESLIEDTKEDPSEPEVVSSKHKDPKISKSSQEMVVYMCKTCKVCFPARRMLEEHNATIHATVKKDKEEEKNLEMNDEVSVQVGDRLLFTGYYKDKDSEYGCMYCAFKSMDRAKVFNHVTNNHSEVLKLNPEGEEIYDEKFDAEDEYETKHETAETIDLDADDEEFWPIEVVEETLDEDIIMEDVTEYEDAKPSEESGSTKLKKCPQCSFESNKPSTYYSHIKRKHYDYWLKSVAEKEAANRPPEDAPELSCPNCSYKCYKRTTMRMHLKRKHIDPPRKKVKLETQDDTSKDIELDKEEDEEDEEYDDDPSYWGDNIILADEEADTDNSSDKITAKKYLKCPYCPFGSYSKPSLQLHVNRFHDSKTKSQQEEKKENNSQMYTGYACHFCTFVAATVNSINHHTSREHSGQKQPIKEVPVTEYDCDQCEFKSKKRKKMQLHLKNCHNVEANTDGMYVCNVCSYETHSKMGLARHISIKHNKARRENAPSHSSTIIYMCDSCDFQSQNRKTMEWHRKQHTADDVGDTYSCDDCNFSTWTKGQLYLHIKRKHKGVEKPDKSKEVLAEGQDAFIVCDQCDYSCKSKHVMKVHVIRKHTEEYNHECDICGKKYKVKADLTNHIRFQHREQPIICDVCGKTCRNSNLLYLHQKFAHYKTEFECHICHRRLASQANLDDHIIKQHERKENVVCDECGKAFSKVARLKIHKRVHSGIKPYTCKICTKAFARRNGLRQHLLIHSGQRPYTCDICGKNFTQKTGLISHRKSHPGSHPPLPRVTIDHVLNELLHEEEA